MFLAKFDGVARAKSHAPTHIVNPCASLFFVQSGHVKPLLVFFFRIRDPEFTRNAKYTFRHNKLPTSLVPSLKKKHKLHCFYVSG